MKLFKKSLCIITALALLLGCFAVLPVSATTPFVASTVEDLIFIRDHLNAGNANHYDEIVLDNRNGNVFDFAQYAVTHQQSDPNVLVHDGNYVYNWEPIWMFNGIIRPYEQNKQAVIKDLYIDPMAAYDSNGNLNWSKYELNKIGFVSSLFTGGEMRNIDIYARHIEGHHCVAAFCGWLEQGYITHCNLYSTFDYNPAPDGTCPVLGLEGIIIGAAGIGGIAGTCMDILLNRSFTPSSPISQTTESTIDNCTVSKWIQIKAASFDPMDQVSSISVYMNPNQNVLPGAYFGNNTGYIGYTDIAYGLTHIMADNNTVIFAGPNGPHTVRNTTFYDSCGSYAGGIVGICGDNGTVIYNCVNNSYVSADLGYAGGIAGFTAHGAYINSCVNTFDAFIDGGTRYTPRITRYSSLPAYQLNDTLKMLDNFHINHEDYHHPTVLSRDICNTHVGGIVGAAGGGTLIESCSNAGFVEAEGTCGGIAGELLTPYIYYYNGSDPCWYSRITNCFNTGYVTADAKIAGLVGSSESFNTYAASFSQTTCPLCGSGTRTDTVSGYCDNIVENCFNVGVTESSAASPNLDLYAGLVATNGGIISNCYNATEIDSQISGTNMGWIDHCFGLTKKAYDTSVGGICTDYYTFSFSGGLPAAISPAGSISGSSDMCTELNAFAVNATCPGANPGSYYFKWIYKDDAEFPFRNWVDDQTLGYIVFGQYNNGPVTSPYTRQKQIYTPRRHSLSLEGDISINFYTPIENVSDDAFATFTVGSSSYTVPVNPNLTTIDPDTGELLYQFACPVNSSQISMPVTGFITNFDGDGEKIVGTEFTYSVNDYIDAVSAMPSMQNKPELMNLMNAIAVYGFYSNKLLGTDADFTPAACFDDTGAMSVTSGMLTPYTSAVNNNSGLNYYGSSLILESTTAIRHYFTLAPGDSIENYTFTLEDGNELTPGTNGSYYFIEISNVASGQLSHAFTVNITDGAGGSCEISYSGLSYAARVFEREQSGANVSTELINLAKALYLYATSADAYFASVH